MADKQASKINATAFEIHKLASKEQYERLDAAGQFSENSMCLVPDEFNYAASESQGGPAKSAVKLTTNAGSSSTPVYFKEGQPVACTDIATKNDIADMATKTDTAITIADIDKICGITVNG